MAITVGTPELLSDKTLQASFSQSAAASAEVIVADPGAGMRIKVISIVGTVDADATIKFIGGASGADLTGAMDVAGKTGLAWRGTLKQPFLECAPSEAFKVTSTGGSFRGVVNYKVVAGF